MIIGIFPAAGGLGGATHTALTRTIGHDPKCVILVSRHPNKLEKEKAAGVVCRRADFDDESSFEGAFEGIDLLNLISYPSFQHEYRFKVSKANLYSMRYPLGYSLSAKQSSSDRDISRLLSSLSMPL
jgi:hypothetical protein